MVSIDAGTVAAMREHRTRQLAERLTAGSLGTGTDHVLVTETGKPINPSTRTQLMPKFVVATGVTHARLHLRHTHASTLCCWPVSRFTS